MANKDNFTSDEWWQLRNAPLAVAMFVSGADTRTGPVGTIKELSSPLDAAKKAVSSAPAGSLLHDLLVEWSTLLKTPEADDTPHIGAGPDLLSFITNVGKLLDAKASPADALSVKEWLAQAAKISAEAGKEGAVLGLGGEKVSDAEYKALSEIGLALGVTM
jgi:hypothetical protein